MSKMADILFPVERDIGTPEERAAHWLAYLYSGVATDEGRMEFSAWLERSADNARAYRRAQQIWRDMAVSGVEALFPEDADCGEPGGEVVSFERPARRLSLQPVRRGAMAAMMAIAASLVLAIGVWRMEFFDPLTVQSYRTAVGEVKTFALPDGSRVTLAADSRVRATFSKRRRGVDLAQGRAWFDIASDPAKPFTVIAATTQIRVVGTQFDVVRAPDDVSVSVARGIVRVDPLTGGVPGKEGVQLLSGQRVVSTLDGRIGPIERFDPANAALWRTGLLIYRDARLGDVVAEVNRYRVDKIVLADKSLRDIKITMAVRANQTDALLSGLHATAPLQIDRIQSRILVRPKG